MPYRLKRKESVADGVRRIAREEAERATAAAEGDGPPGPRVHDARTRCKKLRGLVRLVRPHLGEAYERENRFLRDAARPLSAVRDAAVVVKAFDDLARRGRLDRAAADAARAVLVAGTAGARDESKQLAAFAVAFPAFRDRIDDWRLDARGFDAIDDGLADSYRRGREAMRKSIETGDDVDRHDWRKQAKYHWYHVRLLRKVWEPAMDVRRTELERLSELLGDDHDLAVLREILHDAAGLDPDHAEPILALIDRRRAKLTSAARPLGERLYAEGPGAFAKRMRRYWKTWRGVTWPGAGVGAAGSPRLPPARGRDDPR